MIFVAKYVGERPETKRSPFISGAAPSKRTVLFCPVIRTHVVFPAIFNKGMTEQDRNRLFLSGSNGQKSYSCDNFENDDDSEDHECGQ